MSIATPTAIPRDPIIPLVLPKAPQPNSLPLPKSSHSPERMNRRRNLQREMDDLSDEENELEDANTLIRMRGYNWLIPIGRRTTQQEEKNDAEDETDESEAGQSGAPASSLIGEGDGEGENDSSPDLDASMEDMDEGDITGETEEGLTEYEEEPSDM
ncbi:hypothetical protein SERLADRAFT_441505 [Serpula lacrymans var. lacrymans S7.9]|nr:uncharacterized protein SERLADRAFT_441505 [Serpula lacrymans var. lacrymans S7.9]EGO21123.1 hypothetical protein SERLADRAFT_441505 [Serpula lacrymans var. lacrymans S7.9]